MQPIRILQVVAKLNIGGLEKVAMNILQYSDRSKFQIDFLVYGDSIGDYEVQAVKLGANVIHMYKSRNQIVFYKSLKKVFKENGPYDVVYSHTYFSSGIVMRAAKACGVKRCISHVHSSKRPQDSKWKRRVYCWVMRRYLNKYSDVKVACSKEAGDNVFGPDAGYTIIRNGIDTEKYRYSLQADKQIRTELDIKDSFVIGNVGRFTVGKNHLFLIDIFNELLKVIPNAHLLIVGDGELKEKISNKIVQLKLTDKITLAGTRDDVSVLLSAMNVFVFPSMHEGLGLSIIEAQASGLITICSDAVPKEAAITELVHFISLDKDPADWAREIVKYDNDYPRKDMTQEVRRSGYDVEDAMRSVYHLFE